MPKEKPSGSKTRKHSACDDERWERYLKTSDEETRRYNTKKEYLKHCNDVAKGIKATPKKKAPSGRGRGRPTGSRNPETRKECAEKYKNYVNYTKLRKDKEPNYKPRYSTMEDYMKACKELDSKKVIHKGEVSRASPNNCAKDGKGYNVTTKRCTKLPPAPLPPITGEGKAYNEYKKKNQDAGKKVEDRKRWLKRYRGIKHAQRMKALGM